MTEIAEEQIGMVYDPASSCGRTSPEQSKKPQTSGESSRSLSGSRNRTLPIFLCLTRESGATPDASMTWTDGGVLRGEYITASFGESPRDAADVALSSTLEDDAPLRYYLSEKAIDGILRRSVERSKPLPTELETALQRQLAFWRDVENRGGKGILIHTEAAASVAAQKIQMVLPVSYDQYNQDYNTVTHSLRTGGGNASRQSS